MADADLDRAVEAAYAGAFWSAGQKCTATRRIYVEDAGLRRVPRAAARADRARRGRRPGRPGDRGRPAREREAAERRSSPAIERGKAEGGTVLAGGERDRRRGVPRRADACSRASRDDAFLSCEEVFGPVTSLYRFADARRGDRARERGRVRALGVRSSRRASHAAQRFTSEIEAGHPARQLADRRRRRARAVRRDQGLGLRPARAGPRRDRVLHRGRDRLPGRRLSDVAGHRRARLPRRLDGRHPRPRGRGRRRARPRRRPPAPALIVPSRTSSRA